MATILNNSASLSYNSGDGTGSAVSNVVSTSLLDSYSITAQKFTANDSFRPGENITYLVTVTNTGTQPVFSVEITDDLGGSVNAPLAYVANSALLVDEGNVIPVTPSNTNPLTIPLSTALQSGENITVIYVAQVSTALSDEVQEITNTVAASARQVGADGEVVESEPVSVTIEREDFAQIDITKSVDKAVISSGDTLTYTFDIENSGNIPATNVVITDILPQGFAVTSVQSVTNGVTTIYDEGGLHHRCRQYSYSAHRSRCYNYRSCTNRCGQWSDYGNSYGCCNRLIFFLGGNHYGCHLFGC